MHLVRGEESRWEPGQSKETFGNTAYALHNDYDSLQQREKGHFIRIWVV